MRELTLHALHSRVVVQFEDDDAALADAAAPAWSRCRVSRARSSETEAEAGAEAGTEADADADAGAEAEAEPVTVRASTAPVESRLQGLTQQVTRALIAAQTGRLLMFHAGAVSHPGTGESLVFVAPGGTGKTTLARALGARYGYLTDETVGIEPGTWRIHPYEKPLSLRTGEPHKAEVSPDEMGLVSAHDQPRVARVILLRRPTDHATGPDVEELGLLDAVAALLPETSGLVRLERPLHVVAELLEHTGPVLRVSYAEAEELLPLVAELIGEAP